jgi:hypothetical protein
MTGKPITLRASDAARKALAARMASQPSTAAEVFRPVPKSEPPFATGEVSRASPAQL